MTNNTDDLIYLPDGVECPAGRVTFGAMIEEQLSKDEPVRELTKREKHHLVLYARWLTAYSRRMRAIYPPGHEIHTDIRYWQFHTCGFLKFAADPVVIKWFFTDLNHKQRRNLVEVTHGAEPFPDDQPMP